jgi:hypothetical protein
MTEPSRNEVLEKATTIAAARESNPGSIQPLPESGQHPLFRLQRILGNREIGRLIQGRRLSSAGKITDLQKKMTVGAADDQHEQEAERVAGYVMNMPDSKSSMKRVISPGDGNAKALQTMPLAASITPLTKRQKGNAEESEDKDKQVQPKSDDSMSDGFEAGEEVETRLTQSKGRGGNLPDSVRAYMEPRFGVDFSQVRVHTGPDAIQMNRDVGAEAFTHGSDIYFGDGHGPANSGLTAHELTHVVQQTGAVNRTPANREYIPEMSVKPDSASVDMGAKHEEKLDILNTHIAPAGTTFHWGGGIPDLTPGLQFVDINPGNSAHAKMHVKATAPGVHVIQANIEHQVPGGAAVATPGPQIPLTVPPPGVFESHFRESASGGGDPKDESKLAVGDKKVLRLNFSHLKGPAKNLDSVSLISGKGYNTVLRPEAVTWINDQGVDIKFDAVAVGSADLTVKLKLGDMADSQAIVSHVIGHVEMPKQEFLNKTIESGAMVVLAIEKATAWMDSLALAYADAWEHHTKALKDQAEFEKLIGDLVLGAALAFVPGGIGGVIGKTMKNAQYGEFLTDGVKDLTKWGFRTAAPALLKGGGGGDGLTAYPEDPFQWRARKGVLIHTEIAKAAETNKQWIHSVNTSDPNFDLDFDPAMVMENSLKIEGENLQTIAPVDVEKQSLVFEKGFWSKWLESFGYKLVTTQSKYATTHSVDNQVGKKVKDRCEKIGLDITPYMEASKAAAQAKKAELEKTGF